MFTALEGGSQFFFLQHPRYVIKKEFMPERPEYHPMPPEADKTAKTFPKREQIRKALEDPAWEEIDLNKEIDERKDNAA